MEAWIDGMTGGSDPPSRGASGARVPDAEKKGSSDDGVLGALLPAASTLGLRPDAPTGITARAELLSVKLEWEPPLARLPVIGYKVYRRSAAGDSLVVGRCSARRRRFTDRTALAGFINQYSVAALNAAGEGPRSREVLVLVQESPDPADTGG